ncbi:hypothetical protein BC659_2210 [Sediminibacterium goheungense]|uniref:Uncharacterized protein n=1 Tax=Sediminibacterium goheungense TaxID=1086393 RepID=A0A4R6IY45_9BACT|nr:hypothetical protein BC659_2210 [Sediminibacterium goheungense]
MGALSDRTGTAIEKLLYPIPPELKESGLMDTLQKILLEQNDTSQKIDSSQLSIIEHPYHFNVFIIETATPAIETIIPAIPRISPVVSFDFALRAGTIISAPV